MKEKVMLKAMTEADRARIGEGIGSDGVALQFEYHKKLLERDGDKLARFGFPQAWAAGFQKTGDAHRQAREARPAGQAVKSAARLDEGRTVRDAKRWCRDSEALLVNRATKIEDPLPDLFTDSLPLRGPLGNDPTVIADRIGGLAELFNARKWKDKLQEMIAPNPDFLVEGARLREALPQKPAAKKAAQADAKQDTYQINVLDGTLWVYFKALNRAGQRYWKRQRNAGRAAEYNLDLLYGPGTGAATPGTPPSPPR
ncbi:MAG: hypothetical protein HY906_18305 [Deltaproteobacteria bacterium]|nr:hypothetical protein [Deltaproteobacteria bacterium]